MRSLLSHNGFRRTVNALALAVLVAWPTYGALGRAIRNPQHWPADDFNILFHGSALIVQSQQYPPELYFLYTPPAVVAMGSLSALPVNVAAAAWVAASVLAVIGCVVLGTSLVGLKSHPWRWTIALAGFVLVSHFVIRDLRSANCNMIYCILLVGALAALNRGLDWWAGLLLASSIILKLYPTLVLVYLLWIGKRRAFAAGVLFMALYAIVLPLAAFGPSGMIGVYGSWWHHLGHVAEKLRTVDHMALVSLNYTIKRVCSPGLAPWLLGGASAAWLGVVASCVWLGRRRAAWGGWDLAVDGGMIALSTVVISPYLESYHPVVAILPVLALVAKAVDASSGQRSRVMIVSALAAGLILRAVCGEIVVGQMHLDGIGIYLQMLLAGGALVAIRMWPRRLSGELLSKQPVAYQRAA